MNIIQVTTVGVSFLVGMMIPKIWRQINDK